MAQTPVEVRTTTDSLALAANWINGADPMHNAWAVDLIRRDHLVQLIPQLQRILSESPATKDEEDVQLAALDAWIEMELPMSPSEIEPFVKGYPTLALILAARATADTTPLLLGLMSLPQNYEAYVATANLLVPRRSPEFTLRVMASLRALLDVSVFTHGNKQGGGSSYSGDSVRKTAMTAASRFRTTRCW